jgi:hypothetical protein
VPNSRLAVPTALAVHASVIIVNYNGGGKLERCLEAVLATVGPEAEVLMVDNASTDGSAEIAQARFPAVRLVCAGENLGFGGGNNLGAQQARGEYLIFLNPDTVALPGWAEALCAPLAADAQIGLVTSKIMLAGRPEIINTRGNDVHLTGLTLCRGMGQPDQGFDRQETVGAVSGAAFAMRRAVFEALGGFDADFFLYMEDTDLSWRAQLAGWRCVFAPKSVVLHDYSLRVGPLKTFYQERNRYCLLLKCLRWRTLLALLPALLLAEVVTWGFVLLGDRANWRNKLRAYGWVIIHWHAIRRARRAVQARRTRGDLELLRRAEFRLDFGQAATGWVVGAARRIFDPLFWAWRAATWRLVRW